MKMKLFLISFLALFLELSLIRWIPANIQVVGYFSNLVLLGTFLGMGMGILLAKNKYNLLHYFPFILVLLISIIVIFRVQLHITSPSILFFKGVSDSGPNISANVLLPFIFIMVAFVYIPISQVMGRLFTSMPSLKAYSIDIIGSLTGTILFSLFSFFSVPSYMWFTIVAVITLFIIPLHKHFKSIFIVIAIVCIPLIPYLTRTNSIWSPYYKITVEKNGNIYGINADNIHYQYISDYKQRERFYFTAYDAFKNHNYKDILIIGAGTGADVATALAEDPGVKSIDAVEIDPKIAELGRNLNPNHPFSDPRVNLIINDGRNFLETTQKKYDLIIYALTDSVVVISSSANIRLESFLFTKESLISAKHHLKRNGLLVLYNYYRRDWLIYKISGTLHEVFGERPFVEVYGTIGKAATFLAGPKSKEVINTSTLHRSNEPKNITTAEDDWPFIYLRKKGIPLFYGELLTIIFFISCVCIAMASIGSKHKQKIQPFFFLLGAGFMVLETKSLVTFGLLFGTTWYVNALVITAVLLLILAANYISHKKTIRPVYMLYIPLFLMLLINFYIPTSIFFKLPIILRYIMASLFYLLPIFFANIIFSQAFKKSTQNDLNFGSNLLGVVFGGLLEYCSLLVGYQYLYLIVMTIYAISIILLPKSLLSGTKNNV